MPIERIEVIVTDLPTRLKREIASGPNDTGPPRQILGKPVMVKVMADGVTGYGQIRPVGPSHIVADTTGSTFCNLCEVYAPKLIGQDLFDLETHGRIYDQFLFGNPAARAALDHAIHDAMGKALGVPVYKLLGGKCQARIPLEWSVGMARDTGQMIDEARRAIDEFHIPVICLKGGDTRGPLHDVKVLTDVRKALGDHVMIGLDPNTAWTVADTLAAMPALKENRLMYLEQPIARRDLRGLAEIRRAAGGIPIMADESVFTLDDAFELAREKAADVFCIKLYKVGGIRAAKKITAVAESAQIRINAGAICAFSQLEAAATAHFYASIPIQMTMGAAEFVFGLGVFGPDPLVPEPGLLMENGHAILTDRPGLGIVVDESAVKALTLRRELIC